MNYVERKFDSISAEEIRNLLYKSFKGIGKVEKALLIHPDYTRVDFSHIIVPSLLKILKEKGLREFHTLNASGTHREMSSKEFEIKLGIKKEEAIFHNHEFFKPSSLFHAGKLSRGFMKSVTYGEIDNEVDINANKLLLKGFDTIFVLSGTLPHEAAGYSGGLKAFVPGISGPNVVNFFHWAAVMVGIPEIIGKKDNLARDIINRASKMIIEKIKVPVFTINMVFDEKEKILPKGLYIAEGYEGFLEAYEKATKLSEKIHIIKLKKPLKRTVQVIGKEYDELWTAGKGSYKLQKPGVLLPGAEIIIYAPHITKFHSNKTFDGLIRKIGYHSKDYVKEFLRNNPDFSKNVAAHVINVRGPGTFDPINSKEMFLFDVTLATGITREDCKAVGLKYLNPLSVQKLRSDNEILWIENGGKYLYEIAREEI